MHCTACRTELPEGARFCGVCGFRLESPPSYPKTAAAEPAPAQVSRIDAPGPPAAQAAAAASLRTAPADAPVLLAHRKTVPPGPEMAAAAAAPPRAEPLPSVQRQAAAQAAAAQAAAQPSSGHSASRPHARTAEFQIRPSGVVRTKTVEIRRASVDELLSQKEPRRQDRFALAVEVTLASEHNFYQGFSENISSGGVFVCTNDIHPVGTQFDLTFTLPEMSRSCTALCEVRWTRDYNTASDLPPGMGLAFLRIAPTDAKAVEVFLRHREPIFWDDGSG